MCILGAIYTVLCVPETKGKTLQEIEEHFKKQSSQSNQTQSNLEKVDL